jgi:hypothetical protein
MREKTNHERLQMVRDLICSFELDDRKTKQIISILEDALDLRAANEIASFSEKYYPDFVKMGDTTLRYEGEFDSGHQYQRVAGNWFVTASYVDGKLVANSKHPYLDHVKNLPLVKCTEEEWRADNGEYANTPSCETIRKVIRWPKDEDDDEPPF